jgi:hypothetical protein
MPSLSGQRRGTQKAKRIYYTYIMRINSHVTRIILSIIPNLYKVWRSSRNFHKLPRTCFRSTLGADIQVLPYHNMRLSDGKTTHGSIAYPILEMVQTATMIFCSGWPRSASLARSWRWCTTLAARLSSSWAVRVQSTQLVSYLNIYMHADPATTIYWHSFVQRFSQILSE